MQTIIAPLERHKALTCERLMRQIPESFKNEVTINHYARHFEKMHILAAHSHQRIVGFMGLQQHAPITTEVTLIAILKPYQQQGIGLSLIDAAERYGRNIRHQYLVVKTPYDEVNTPAPQRIAERFYSKVGFSKLIDIPEIWAGQSGQLMLKKIIMQ